MKMDYWLVAVGAGRWQTPGIKTARRAGLNVFAVDANSNAQGFEHATKSAMVDIRDPAAVLKALSHSGITPDGAIAFCNEAGMSTTAQIRNWFNLPCAGIETTQALTNKGIQREKWTNAKVPGPTWAVVRSKCEVPDALARIGGTVIFKPVDSAGSRGVSVVGQGEEWESAYTAAKQNSLAGEVIVEAFIVGVEHTVETFTHRGKTYVLAVTSKRKVSGTHGTVACELETAHLERETRLRVESVVRQALEALGYVDGPGHTEILLTAGGDIYLVESAGRGGGFMVADGVVPLSCGFDLAQACALQAVGMEPEIPKEFAERSVVLRFIPSQAGRVVSISGFQPQDEIPGVISESMVAVGQNVGHAQSDADRMAFILSAGESLPEARAKADLRERRIKITVT